MGTKMMTSEMVVATTASVISLVASIAAVFGNSYFSSMNRTMFSSTTIASSMTMPTASVRPSKVILLRVKSMALSSVKVAMTDVGIASDAITTDRRFRMNSKTTKLAGKLSRLAVHPESSIGCDRIACDSNVRHRHLHAAQSHGLHPQQYDLARPDARGGHRHRRCDRGAGEHCSIHRRKIRVAEDGGNRRYQRDYAGGCGDYHFARHHFCSHSFHDRLCPALRQRIWLDDGFLRHGFHAGQFHFEANVELALPKTLKCQSRRRKTQLQRRRIFPLAFETVRPASGMVSRPQVRGYGLLLGNFCNGNPAQLTRWQRLDPGRRSE